MIYQDRFHAGEELVKLLNERQLFSEDITIVAIPNGGIPVAIPIANFYEKALKVLIARKIQYPWTTEAGFGAITSDGAHIYNESAIKQSNLTKKQIKIQSEKAMAEIRLREQQFQSYLLGYELSGKKVILVDDGIASGITTQAALKSLQNRHINHVYCATPTAHSQALEKIKINIASSSFLIDFICPDIKSGWRFAVADAYRKWVDETTDHTLELLEEYYLNLEKNTI